MVILKLISPAEKCNPAETDGKTESPNSKKFYEFVTLSHFISPSIKRHLCGIKPLAEKSHEQTPALIAGRYVPHPSNRPIPYHGRH